MPHMPRSISAKKRVRQNERQRARNRHLRSRIRSARRTFLEAVAAADLDRARTHLRECERLLHRAAGNGPLHRKTAGRVIGRLRRRLSAAEHTAGAAT